MFFPDFSPVFSEILSQLRGKPIAVLGHLRPDGDCIGSQVGLTRVLRSLGIDAVCVNKHSAPKTLQTFLDNTPYILASAFTETARIPIACDCADAERFGEELNTIYPEILLCIDHHISNKGFAATNLIAPTAAATSEILAGIFFDLNIPIDPIAAQALYVGIATDTGQFQYGATSQRVFEISARLLQCGANPAKASFALYEQESFARIKLLQRYLATLRQELEGRVCIGHLYRHDYTETESTFDDTEGFVNYARCLVGVDIGIILEERDTLMKGSLRAKDPAMRVDRLAAIFGGGGHSCAAGFSIKGEKVNTFYPKLLDSLTKHFDSVQ